MEKVSIHQKYSNLNFAYKILDIAKEDQKGEYDSVFIITGRERSGKSNLMLHFMEYLGVTPDLINRICFEGEDFIKELKVLPEGGVIALDEAGDSLFNRDGMTRETKDFIKSFQAIGGLKFIVFLVIPSFFRLEKYFREDRVKGLFHVYQRGHYVYFPPKQIKWINRNGYIKLPPQRSPERKYFPEYKGKLLQKYLNLKRKKMRSILEKPYNNKKPKKKVSKRDTLIVQLKNKGMGVTEIARLTDMSRLGIYKILKRMATDNPDNNTDI